MNMNNFIYKFPPNVRKAWDEMDDDAFDEFAYQRIQDNVDEYGDLFEDFIDEI
jgi:hypothetical protein